MSMRKSTAHHEKPARPGAARLLGTAAVIAAALPLALLATADCKSFSCEELANCPRTDSGGGGTAGNGSGGGATGGAGGSGGGMGTTCTDPSECSSNFCVDGYCCDSACDGLCESCAVAGAEGSCAPAAAASNEDSECGAGVCDGSGRCAEGGHLMSTSYGLSLGDEFPTAMAVNDAGLIAVAGQYNGTGVSNFGGSNWNSMGVSDGNAFMGSYDAMLGHRFSHGYRDEQSPTGQFGYAAAIDPSGFVITAGTFEGNTYFLSGGGTLTQSTGERNMYIVRVGVTGGVDWAQDYGSDPGSQTPTSLAVNNAGEIFVTGHFEDDIDFGSPDGQLTAAGVLEDVFIAKLNPNGTGVWARRFGDGNVQHAEGVALDGDGNVLLVGDYQGTINFGGDTLLEGDDRDGFVVKLDPDGNHLWSNSYTGNNDQEPMFVAADGDGNIIFAGEVETDVDLGGGELPGLNVGVFVAKLDPDGNHLWSHRFDTSSQNGFEGLAVDSVGNVIFAGEFFDSFTCGGDTLPAQGGSRDIYICKLSKDGVHLWSHAYGDSAAQYSAGVGVDGLDNVYLSGSFEGPFDLGGPTLNHVGSGDMFLAQLSP